MLIIPSKSKEIRELRNKEIRALYRIGYTYEEISRKLNVSRTTIFFAIKGRNKYKIGTGRSKDAMGRPRKDRNRAIRL